jgi:ATP-dependent Zn protease
MTAADYIRRFGFTDQIKLKIVPPQDEKAALFSTDFEQTNELVQQLIEEQRLKAWDILQTHREFLLTVSRHLIEKTSLTADEFVALAKLYNVSCQAQNEEFRIIDPYAQILEKKPE